MTDDYLEMVVQLGLASNTFTQFLTFMLLAMGRLLPIIMFSPFFGAKILPHPVKVTFALSLFVIFLPMMLRVTTATLEFNMFTFFLLLKEVFVGTCIGLIMSMPFFIAQNAGVIIDHQRGGASLMVNDPTIQNQSSPLGTLNNLVFIIIFYQIGGPFVFIEAIMTSYEVVPPDKFLNATFFLHDAPFWVTVFQMLNKVMVLSIQLACPGLIMILMTDVFLGIANRLAPQVQITFLGMPLKSLLALLVVCLGYKAFAAYLGKESVAWLQLINEMIQGFAVGVTKT